MKRGLAPNPYVYAHAQHIYTAADFGVGQQVYYRTWTVPAGNAAQQPQVWKRTLYVTEVWPDGRIYCGNREYRAFELVPA